MQVCPKRLCMSTVGVRKDLFKRDPNKVLVTDFFGSVRPVEITRNVNYNVSIITDLNKKKPKKSEKVYYRYVPALPTSNDIF